MSADKIKFGSDDMGNVLARLSPEQIDDLPFGAIKLDFEGRVLLYNAAEGTLAGRKPEDVLGKNFFTEVAPCTKRPEFYGRFQQGVREGQLNTLFEYVFDHKMKPTKVVVHMTTGLTGKELWIFVRRY